MRHDPISTIEAPIYRDITETLNKTLFDVYVTESYQPVVHGYYLDHPEITPINLPDPFEADNLCNSRLPLSNIVDIIVTGQHFRWKHASDAGKAADFLKTYIDQFEHIDLSKDNEQRVFLDKVKHAYKIFFEHDKDRRDREEPKKPKRLSLIDRIRALGF